MNSIEYRMQKIQKENHDWSSFICFVEAIKKRNYSERTVSKWFKRLVEKDDYAVRDKKEILLFLMSI